MSFITSVIVGKFICSSLEGCSNCCGDSDFSAANNICSLSCASSNEEIVLGPPPEEDELKRVIHAITHNVTESDKKELMELLAELIQVTEDIIDDVLQLEKLIDAFLTDDYLEGKPLLPLIDQTPDGFPTITKYQNSI